MIKLLYVTFYVIIFTFVLYGLSAIFNVPTYEISGPLLIGAISVLLVEVYTMKEGR